MESSEHNWADSSETSKACGKWACWMLPFPEYPDKSHNFTN